MSAPGHDSSFSSQKERIAMAYGIVGRILIAGFACLAFAVPMQGATTIAWNPDTYLTMSNSAIPADCGDQLYYPRMCKAPNGHLLLFAQSGNSINGGCILMRRSIDGGWSFGPWTVIKRWGQRQWFEQNFNAQHANA